MVSTRLFRLLNPAMQAGPWWSKNLSIAIPADGPLPGAPPEFFFIRLFQPVKTVSGPYSGTNPINCAARDLHGYTRIIRRVIFKTRADPGLSASSARCRGCFAVYPHKIFHPSCKTFDTASVYCIQVQDQRLIFSGQFPLVRNWLYLSSSSLSLFYQQLRMHRDFHGNLCWLPVPGNGCQRWTRACPRHAIDSPVLVRRRAQTESSASITCNIKGH